MHTTWYTFKPASASLQAAVDRHRSAVAVKERESEGAAARASLTRQVQLVPMQHP